MVKSALRMLALYTCFNGTGVWGGETLWDELFVVYYLHIYK